MSIGHGQLPAALAVGYGAWIGSGAFRTDTESPARIDAGQGSSSCSHGVDVDDVAFHHHAGNPDPPGIERAGGGQILDLGNDDAATSPGCLSNRNSFQDGRFFL